jgi:hypothetical protein
MIHPNQTRHILSLLRRYGVREVAWIVGVEHGELRRFVARYLDRVRCKRRRRKLVKP